MKLPMIPLTPREKFVVDSVVSFSRKMLESERGMIPYIEELDRERIYLKMGYSSTFVFCMKHLNLTESVAYAVQNIARKSRKVPELSLAVQEGEISTAQASRICSQITPDNSAELIEAAADLTQDELKRKLAGNKPGKQKRASKKAIDRNNSRYAVDLPNLVLDKLKRVKELENKRTRKAVTEAVALEAALDEYLRKHDPVQKAERAAARAEKVALPVKPNRPVSRPIPKAKREPLTAAQKHALAQRDRDRCQVELSDGSLCGESAWTENHHIVPVALGGTNDIENLVTLCSAHHRMMHLADEHSHRGRAT